MELQIIQNKIYEIRGQKVMLDFDLAELYATETRLLKRAVRRNIDRFPIDFMFELSTEEANSLLSSRVSQNGTPQYNFSAYKPFAFTEQGVAMLSSVLHSEVAIRVNINIIINGKTNCSTFTKHFVPNLILLTQNKMCILLRWFHLFSSFVYLCISLA